MHARRGEETPPPLTATPPAACAQETTSTHAQETTSTLAPEPAGCGLITDQIALPEHTSFECDAVGCVVRCLPGYTTERPFPQMAFQCVDGLWAAATAEEIVCPRECLPGAFVFLRMKGGRGAEDRTDQPTPSPPSPLSITPGLQRWTAGSPCCRAR
jgi:hypothetical protein